MSINHIVFKASNIHQGHHVYVNGENTHIIVNLHAYDTIDEYKVNVDKRIEEFINNQEKEKQEILTYGGNK
jgi:hypothetical protein